MKRKKIMILSIIIIILISSIALVSYAYIKYLMVQESTNNLASICFKLTLEEQTKGIQLENAIPITDTEGSNLTPYTFSIQNICDNYLQYQLNLETLNTTDLNSKNIKVQLDHKTPKKLNEYDLTEPIIQDALESHLLDTGKLGPKESVTYNLRVWMDEETTVEEGANKTFQSKVTLTASYLYETPTYCQENNITNLSDCILATETKNPNIAESKESIIAKGDPDFTKITPQYNFSEKVIENQPVSFSAMDNTSLSVNVGLNYIYKDGMYQITSPSTYSQFSERDLGKYTCGKFSTPKCMILYKIKEVTGNTVTKADIYTSNEELIEDNSGIYMMADDYGDSFYFRGDISNNYVYFGGFYWQILRINGDGSIRLIYYGKQLDGTEAYIGVSAYNNVADDNTYFGYLYGATSAPNYLETHTNNHDSTMKSLIDSWYLNSGLIRYKDKISDTLFCNDRSLAESHQNAGFNQIPTLYAAKMRGMNSTPSLKCSQKNDRLTVSDAIIGNPVLKHPIALITLDEGLLAGSVFGVVNSKYFLQIQKAYYTLSADYFNTENDPTFYCQEIAMTENGTFSSCNVSLAQAVRPVINLKGNVEIISGDGTKKNPYKIK